MKKISANILFVLVVFCSCPLTAAPAVKKPAEPAKLLLGKSGKFPFLFCKYRFDLKPYSYMRNRKLSDYLVKNLEINLRPEEKNRKNDQKIYPLYPVYNLDETADKDKFECIFLLPEILAEKLQKHKGGMSVSVSAAPADSRYGGLHDAGEAIADFSLDEAETAKLRKTWMHLLKRRLTADLADYEDTEFETFMYMRLFNSVPEQRPDNWKKDDAAKLLFSFSGLNDIRDAVPLDKNGEPLMEPYDQEAPKPLALPQVNVEKTEIEPGLAKWIPRSCYFLEWRNAGNFKATLSGFAQLFDKWSPGTYPLSGEQIIAAYMKKLGLDDKKIFENVEAIALGGWDFYFQSGSSVLAVLKTRTPVEKLPAAPYASSPEKNIIVLSNSEKLHKMALNSYAKKRSLSQLNNFAYSRKKLGVANGEKELVWLYLSDYWLTNLISPRWMILNSRIARLDARLRFIYLLKICRMFETFSGKLPPLGELEADPFLRPEIKKWLFSGLLEKDGIVQDEKLGTLYKHPPIDQVPFDKVSKKELADYNNFKRAYTGRWRQIDPIAFQFSEDKNGVYKTRLYISPVSNRSDFRFIRNFAPVRKVKHSFRKIKDKAFALSVAVAAQPLKPFLKGIALPVNVFVQLTGFDFAPSSYSPATWLEPQRTYDNMSYLRIPAAVSLPSLVFNSLTGLAGRVNLLPSDYDKISKIDRMEEIGFSLLVLEKKSEGLYYLGADPGALIRIRDNSSSEIDEDSVPCDIRLYLNLINAYQMRRKIWFEALKNRGIATWRRMNRIFRIRQFFGLEPDFDISRGRIIDSVKKFHIFPTRKTNAYYRTIPCLRNTPASHWNSSFVLESFRKLPEPLLRIIQLDSFISVENNALMFESHFRFRPEAESGGSVRQPPDSQPAAQNTTDLDFDE
ncbi:MAG: hypothetical protein PHV82_08860 [Victivallaceae bacterium]|nr:hypothetical protein [Victivallaceae bacterium]